ncbi:MAG TPA: lantibiotic dehydratase, partial [Actinophytocola sp.]|nr:lantibiotic dehydratase [Actinophytocola sp.]
MSDTPVHLGERWRLWEQFALRGPGFPASGVLRLAPPGLAEAADKFTTGSATVAELTGPDWDAFAAEFGETAVQTAVELQRIAASPSFQAAVAWQNRPILDSGIAPFLSWEPSVAGRTSRARDREGMVAHYWQRFCVKNDSIGFFGPVGWGRWDLTRRGISVDPGTGLVERTTLYFSSWAVDTLAKTLDEDPDLRDWVAPRRVPFVRASGDGVLVPGRAPQPATPAMLAVLARCDGTRSVRDLRGELGSEFDAALAELVRRRWVVHRLEVAAGPWPERHLRAWLEGVGDPAARSRGLDRLDRFDRGRERIRDAGGDVAALTAAMSAMEAEFTELTAAAAVREKSRSTAPCRALVYADCVRAARAGAGTEVLAALAPLDLMLTSVAWMTSTLAERVMAAARKVYDRLAVAGPVDLASFWFGCLPILHGDATGWATELQHEFRRRWLEILRPTGEVARVRRSTVDMAAAVRTAFGDRPPGWAAARYLSPDVLVAAEDAAAVERGEFELVLGELHVASNTLGFWVFVSQHPAPDELFAETSRDHPEPRLLPMLAKEHRARLSTRTNHALVRPEDYYVGLVDYTADPHRPRTVCSADVSVELRDDQLTAVLPDGRAFPAVEIFAHVLTTMSMDLFRLMPEDAHTPRVTVDRLVVARETWRFTATDLDFARDKDESRRYVRT